MKNIRRNINAIHLNEETILELLKVKEKIIDDNSKGKKVENKNKKQITSLVHERNSHAVQEHEVKLEHNNSLHAVYDSEETTKLTDKLQANTLKSFEIPSSALNITHLQ